MGEITRRALLVLATLVAIPPLVTADPTDVIGEIRVEGLPGAPQSPPGGNSGNGTEDPPGGSKCILPGSRLCFIPLCFEESYGTSPFPSQRPGIGVPNYEHGRIYFGPYIVWDSGGCA